MAQAPEVKEIERDIVVPPLPTTERGYGFHLGGTVKRAVRIAYGSAALVVQREVGDVNKCSINPQHGYAVKVAKYSPNGEWICSGDSAGHCFVWAHESMVVKNEIDVGNCVLDIAWSGDQQRIFAVGRGKEDKGKVFPWNTNNKLGDIVGASKTYLSCDFTPKRPFKGIAGSEDFGVYFYGGTPMKFVTYDKTHKNYVNCVRFSPDGSCYLTTGSDRQILVFDGKQGTLIRPIVDKKNGHKGTIYALSWSPDGTQFMTASADKTCKVWDFESGSVIQTFKTQAKPTVLDMQVACLWLGDNLISVSLSGRINYWKLGEENPIRIVTGHRKLIQDMTVDKTNGFVYSCDVDSRIVRTECKTGECEDFIGDPHKGNQIKLIQLDSQQNSFYTIDVADTIFRHTTDNLELAEEKEGVKLDGAARGLVTGNTNNDLAIVPTHKNKIIFLNNLEITATAEVGFTPTCCALSPDDSILAVAGEDNKFYFYNVDDQKESQCVESDYIRNSIVAMAYSPDGKFLATADKTRHIWIWDIAGNNFDEPLNKTSSFQFHNSVPTSLAWSDDSTRLLSSGMDSNIYLWLEPTQGKSTNVHLDNAFQSGITSAQFLDAGRIVATGKDCTIRFFNIRE